MKLPGIQYGGVQSLGRYDTGGPMRAANAAAQAAGAEARAAGATAQALQATGDVAMRFYEANAAAEYDRAVAEAQKHETMLRKMLLSGPVLDTQRWQMPEWVTVPGGRSETIVDEKGQTQTVPRRFVPTHEVASQIYSGSMQRVQAAIEGEVRNPLARAQLRRKLPAMFNAGEAQVAASQHKFYIAHQKGHVAAAIEDFIQAGDEQSARTAAMRAYHTGLLEPADFEKAMTEIGSRVDSMAYMSLLNSAKTPAEVEQVESLIKRGIVQQVDPETGQLTWGRSRLDPDKQWQMRNRAQELLTEADTARSRSHRDNMQGYVEQFLRHKLTFAEVANGLAADRMNHTQAMTLGNALRARAKEKKTSPATLDGFRRQIHSARWLQQGERQSEKLADVEQTLNAALTGMYPNGREYRGPPLSSKDHKTLLAELRREESSTTRQPAYKQAVEQIRGITRYSPLFPGDENSSARAYIDFKRALDDYTDRYGAGADPLGFIKDQADRFDPDMYAGKSLRNFVERHPNYAVPVPAAELDKPENAAVAREQIQAQVTLDLLAGKIDEEQARVLILQAGGEDMILGVDDDALDVELGNELDQHGSQISPNEDLEWE